MTTEKQHLATGAGRRLAYIECGDPHGHPIIYCHGFPSTSLEVQLVHPMALTARARIVAPDRPGCGDSSFRPLGRIADWADDVVSLTDALQIERFAILGVSGGGPYALACAARLAERTTACALVCSLGPVYLAPVLAGMGRAARIGFATARRAPWLSGLLLERILALVLSDSAQMIEALRTLHAPDADLAVLEDSGVRDTLNAAVADAVKYGARSVRQDLALYARDWGIQLSTIELPTVVWHGAADAIVPVGHTHWYARNLPEVHANVLPSEGHFSLPVRYGEAILNDLVRRGWR